MRSHLRRFALLALLAAVPSVLAAQSSTPATGCTAGATCPPADTHAGMMAVGQMGRMEQCRTMLETGTAQLDSLMKVVDAARGPARVDAMAAVLNALLTERKAMQEHMSHMMEMMHGGHGSESEHSPSGDH